MAGRVVLFNKPFRVLSQFRESGDKKTLADFIDDPALRVAGRLDYDSEGLLLLSDDGRLVQRISHPRFKLEKTYLAQVEGEPGPDALAKLETGVTLNDGPTLPARARLIDEPGWLWPRHPPIRYRANIPTYWIELTISEGRNRQVRRMTAAVGHPTLRLIRVRVGDWVLGELGPGTWAAV
jgi:23S rRNA pseudouridine2457 synthase